MADISLSFNNQTGYCDWAVSGDDLANGDDLTTAVMLSLFTDARAPDSLEIYSTDRRGWWGTTYNDSAVAELGSLLWTLERAIKSDSQEVLRRAEGYAEAALQWLIDDGVASTVVATASWAAATVLWISVTITQPKTKNTFSFAWDTLP